MLQNEILFFISLILIFSAVLFAHKVFGKQGLFAIISMLIILANIEVSCQVNMFGFKDGWVTLGNVAFAAIFLATDILNECYSYKDSKKAVHIAAAVIVLFLGLIQLDLLFKPASDSFMHDTLKTYFGLDSVFVWVALSSVVCFYLANLLDVWLFNKMRSKTGAKKLWVRNNVATIVATCTENFLLFFLGYYLLPMTFNGSAIINIEMVMMMGAAASLIEILVSLLDTPFVYLARRLKTEK